MNIRDKQIIIILISISILIGGLYIGMTRYNNDTTDDISTPTIVVNGNGSTGTGDIQNVQQVTTVQTTSGSSGSTKTVYIEQEVTTGPNGTGATTDYN